MEFLEIHDQYFGKVRKFILAYVKDEWIADDLIQETFERVMEKHDTIEDPSRLSSWIFRIAVNLCHDHYRKARKSRADDEADGDSLEDSDALGLQKQMEREEMSECVQEKMALLPESMKAMLLLFDTMEFSHQEIADILGISVENTKVRLHRARQKMKEILQQECTFEHDERNVLVCDRRPK